MNAVKTQEAVSLAGRKDWKQAETATVALSLSELHGLGRDDKNKYQLAWLHKAEQNSSTCSQNVVLEA